MSKLIEKIRRSRETRLPLDHMTFVLRRPTDLEMVEKRGRLEVRDCSRFIVGWEGVTEADIVTGGDPHPVSFSSDLAAEWIEDRMDIAGPVATALVDAYMAHVKALEDAKKK